MNERAKQRHRDQTRDQNAFQLNSRQSRNYLSGRVVSMIRANDQSGQFSAQELIQIESLLRDEFQTNQWLLNVCKAFTDESVFVTKEELEMFEKHKNEGKDVFVTQSQVDELNKELNFLRERADVLLYILKEMTQNLSQIRKNDSIDSINAKKSDSNDVWLEMRTKLMESLEIIEKDLTTDLNVEEPKHLVQHMVSELNGNISQIESIQNPDQWVSQLLDELALSEDNTQILKSFDRHFCSKMGDIHKNLMDLHKECLRIKKFYEINVKEEISWRTDLMELINHLISFSNTSKIKLNSTKSESNQLLAKKDLIEEYSQFFSKVESLEFDELETLIEKMKERIEILSDKNK